MIGAAIAAAALAGFGLGLAYFAMLRRSVQLFATGGALGAAALTFGRVALAILIFAATTRLGGPALLACFAGFLAARAVALRMARA